MYEPKMSMVMSGEKIHSIENIVLPFSGAQCIGNEYPEQNSCKIFWAATVGGRTISAEADIPDYKEIAENKPGAERILENQLRNSVVRVEGV